MSTQVDVRHMQSAWSTAHRRVEHAISLANCTLVWVGARMRAHTVGPADRVLICVGAYMQSAWPTAHRCVLALACGVADHARIADCALLWDDDTCHHPNGHNVL